MIIRPATAADLPRLSWLDEGTATGLAAAVAAGPRALVLVALTDTTTPPRGVLALELPPWHGRRIPWLWLVEVAPGCRDAGLGSALLAHAHRGLADRGHRVVELHVADDNARARALYDRLGYRPTGTGGDPGDDERQPGTRMQLALRSARVTGS